MTHWLAVYQELIDEPIYIYIHFDLCCSCSFHIIHLWAVNWAVRKVRKNPDVIFLSFQSDVTRTSLWSTIITDLVSDMWTRRLLSVCFTKMSFWQVPTHYNAVWNWVSNYRITPISRAGRGSKTLWGAAKRYQCCVIGKACSVPFICWRSCYDAFTLQWTWIPVNLSHLERPLLDYQVCLSHVVFAFCTTNMMQNVKIT